MKPKLTLTQGLPGSGKSTWAREEAASRFRLSSAGVEPACRREITARFQAEARVMPFAPRVQAQLTPQRQQPASGDGLSRLLR